MEKPLFGSDADHCPVLLLFAAANRADGPPRSALGIAALVTLRSAVAPPISDTRELWREDETPRLGLAIQPEAKRHLAPGFAQKRLTCRSRLPLNSVKLAQFGREMIDDMRHLGRRPSAEIVNRVDRIERRLPVRQYMDQAALGRERREQPERAGVQAGAGEDRLLDSADIIDAEPGVHRHARGRAAPMREDQLIPRLEEREKHKIVPLQIGGRLGKPVIGKILRRREKTERHGPQPSRRQRAVAKVSNTNGDVDIGTAQVDVAIIQQQLDSHLRKRALVVEHPAGHVAFAQIGGTGQTQQTARNGRLPTQVGLERVLFVNQAAQRLIIAQAGSRGRRAARATLDELDAEPRLKSREAATNRGHVGPHLARRRGQRTRFNDTQKRTPLKVVHALHFTQDRLGNPPSFGASRKEASVAGARHGAGPRSKGDPL